MLDAAILQNIVNNYLNPILLAKKTINTKNDIELEFIFQNEACKNIMNDIFGLNIPVLNALTKLSETINWKELLKNDKLDNVSNSFYSFTIKKWILITISSLKDNIILFVLNDITCFTEHENQLKQQNFKLEELTEALQSAQENQLNKIANIKALNSKLEQAAFFDTLTQLPNRADFSNHIQDIVCKARSFKENFGLMLMDIDNFKNINDSRGHLYGDEILAKTGKLLKQFERNNIHIYRFGGDEFLVLATSINSKDSMLTIADTIFESLNSQNIQVSAGISLYPEDSEDSDELLKFADMALHEVKQKGKNNIFFFHYVMKNKFLDKIQLETKLHQAINDGLFQLYYQPQVDITNNSLRGFEALLRWFDKDIGWISPERFIPVAEESRLVIPLGLWVIETACKTLAKWQQEFNFQGIMSVNISPIQFKKPGFLTEFLDIVNKYNINKPSLEIEITEGILIENFSEILPILQTIRNEGIGISLDDFGTGYSSLSYLQLLPLTTLKIDKCFVENITQENSIESEITSAIISLVTKMGLDTIAEGVENEAQLQILINKKCKNTQGFLMGKPMPDSLCERMLNGDESAILRIDTGNQPIRYSV